MKSFLCTLSNCFLKNRFLTLVACALLGLLAYVPVSAQTTLVTWTFPSNPDNATADGGIAANTSQTISVQKSAGNLPTLDFATAGATTNAANATGWDAGSGAKWWELSLSTSGYNTIKLSSKQRSSGTGPKDWKVQYKIGVGGTWTDASITVTVANDFTTGVVSNVTLNSAVNGQSSVYLRWIMTSNTNVNNTAVVGGGTSRIDDIVVTGVVALCSPTPQAVPFSANFGTAGFNTFPTGFCGWKADGTALSTQTLAEASTPSTDATVTTQSSAFGSEPSGALYGYATSSNGRLCISTSNNATDGLNQPVCAINTGAGVTCVTVAYDLEVLFTGSGNRSMGISLQYRQGSSGSWTAVSGSAVTYAANANPALNSITSRFLTISGLTASTDYQFRWVSWRNHGSGSVNLSIGLDNVVIGPSVITVSAGALAAVNTTYGTASATPTSFTVSGVRMSAGILITPPTGFEVSQTAGGASGYANTQTVGAAGTISTTTVYVRLKATTGFGTYSGNIVCSSACAADVNKATVSSTVSKATVTITANDVNKTYGTTLTGGTGRTTFTFSAFQNSESIGTGPTVTIAYGTGAAANAAVGTYSTSAVVPSALVAGSGSTYTAANYTFSYVAGNIIIGAKALTVTATGPTKVYGTALTAGTSITNFTAGSTGVGTETVTGVTLTPDANGASATTPAGSLYTITPSLATGNNGFLASNYNITYVPYNGTIDQKTLTVDGATAQDKFFDGNTDASITGGTLIGVVGSDDVTLVQGPGTGTFASSAVGTNIDVTASLSITGTDAGNYTLDQPTGLKADISVAGSAPTIVDQSANGTYGTPFSYYISAAGATSFSATGLPAGLSLDTVTGEISGTLAVVTGSPFSVAISGRNNIGVNSATLTLTIDPATLTITAPTIAPKVYDASAVSGTVTPGTLSGFVGIETVILSSVTGLYADANAANGKTATVTYTLADGTNGGLAVNYVLANGSALGNITPKPLSITTPTIAPKTYNASATSGTVTPGTLSGFVGTETVTVSAATGAYLNANAAIGKTATITYTLANGTNGGLAINYSLTGTGTGDINPKALAITAPTIAPKVYNASSASGTVTPGTLSGFVGTETVTATATGAYADANAGTGKSAVITYTLANGANGGLAINYSLANGSASGNITPKVLSITAPTIAQKTYDASAASGTVTPGTLSGFIGSETVTVSAATGAYSNANAGTGKSATITYTLADGTNGGLASNYSLTGTGTGNIIAKALSITLATIAPKTYNGTTTSGTVTPGTLSGFVGTETVTVSAATGTYADANAATGKTASITYTLANGANGGLAANYSLANTSADGDIIKANQTITFGTLSPKTTLDADYAPGATSPTSGTNPITYTSSDPNVATIVSGNIHIVGAGTTIITASQAASTNYNAAADVTQSLVVTSICLTNTFPVTTSPPPGWAGNSTNDNAAGHYISAPNCRAIGSGDNLITPAIDFPTAISFFVDASSNGNNGTGTLAYQVGGTGGTWTNLTTFTATTAGATFSYTVTGVPLTSADVYFRISSSVNTIYIDDVVASCSNMCSPVAQTLPYTQNFGTTAFNTLPTGFCGWGGIDGSATSTQTLAQNSVPASNAILTSQSAAFGSSEPAGGLFGYATSSNARLCIATSNSTTEGLDQPVVAINTGAGVTSVTIAYDLEVLFSGDRTMGVVLQYRAGTTGSWTSVAASAKTYAPNPTLNSITGNAYTITGLTASSIYQFRWATWRVHNPGSKNTSIALDNVVITAGQPTLTEVFLPQYIQGETGTNDERTPYAFRVSLTNLLPSATYRYYNQVVETGDPATLNGVGNSIFPIAGGFTETTGPSLSSAGDFGTFTTDASGSYTGWFVTEPTGDGKFSTGNQLYMRIMLNTSLSNSVTEDYRLTTTNTATVLTYGTTGANRGTGIRGSSSATARNFILLYDNNAGSGRPIAGTYVESDGVANTTGNSFVGFYSSSVNGTAGAWGTIIPNSNANGVRRIEQRAFSDGSLVGCAKTSTGVWPTGNVNTINPAAGTSALAISGTDAPLTTCPATVTFSSNHPAAGNIVTGTKGNNLYSIKLDVTDANATFTAASFTTAGTYSASDVSKFKLYYGTSASIASAAAIDSVAGVSSGNTISFSGFSRTINTGTSAYLFVVADVSATAAAGDTIIITSTTFSNINLGSVTKIGTDPVAAGNKQAIIVPTVAINSLAVAAGIINQGSNDNIIYSFSAAVTVAPATFTGITLPIGLTNSADFQVAGFKLWYKTSAGFAGAAQVGSGVSYSGGNVVFSGLSQVISAGTTGYFFVTANVAPAATVGDTIRANALAIADIIFNTTSVKSGTTSIAGTQTIVSVPYVLFDNFDRTNSNTVGTPSSGGASNWSETEYASEAFRARIEGGFLRLQGCTSGSTGSTGSTTSEAVYYDMSTKYSTTFANAPGDMIWSFNLHSNASGTSGFNSNTYGSAFILGSDASDFRSASANGYAVIIGNQNSPDPVKLVYFTGGLNNGTITDIVSSTETGETDYYSVKVNFNPCTQVWSLQVRNDNGSFADPTGGVYGAAITGANSIHTAKDLKYMGALWQHSSNCTYYDEFDNFFIPSGSSSVQITAQPQADTVCPAATASFSVSAISNSTLSYQWRKGGVNINGATAATYTINSAVAGDAGNYDVIVSNSCNISATSTAVALTVNTAPQIVDQPVADTACANSAANFVVNASGTGLTYQWRKQGVNISGATSPSYNISSAATGDAGNYDVVVSGTCSPNVTSTAVALTVNTAPQIIDQPVATSVCVGGAASFLVNASGTSLTYQWRKQSVDISGATSPSYSISSAATGDAGNYDVVISGTCSPVATSTPVALTVNSCINSSTWVGVTDSNWTSPSNWSPASVPNSCAANIIIPAGTPYYPVISGANVTVGNVDIAAGVRITLRGQDMNVCGSWKGGDSANAAVIGSGTVFLNSSAGQQSVGGNTQFHILEINNTDGVVLDSGAKVAIQTGLHLHNGDLNITSGSLRLLSASSTNNSYIDDFTTGFNGKIIGTTVTAERYIPVQGYNQHFISSPVDRPTFSQIGASGQNNAYIIPSQDCNEYQSSPSSPYGSVFQYNDGHQGVGRCKLGNWQIRSQGNLENGRGYSSYQTGNSVISVTGTANTGNITISGLNNAGDSSVRTAQGQPIESGWNLVGNPYPSAIKLTVSRDGNGFQAQVQVWKTSGPFKGTWQQRIIGTHEIVIPPFQAFMVRVKPDSTGLRSYPFYQSERVRTTDSAFYRTQSDNTLELNLTFNGMTDVTTISFNPSATRGFDDQYDANKPNGAQGRPTLYTSMNDNHWYSINNLPTLQQLTTVPMGLRPENNGTMTIAPQNIQSFDATTYIYLEDKKTGKWHNLRDGAYTFTTSTTDNQSRFVLHFTPPVEVLVSDASCQSNGMINISQPGSASWNYSIVNSDNATIANGTLNSTNPITASAIAGIYTLVLTDADGYQVVKNIHVSGGEILQAAFNTGTSNNQEFDNVVFTSNTDNAAAYNWNFGDGSTATGRVTNHSYATEGVYTATLTVMSATGCSSSGTQTITITGRTATGVGNIAEDRINIWSNANRVYIDFSKQSNVDAEIEIFDVLGQTLSHEKFGRSSVYQKEMLNIAAAYLIIKVRNDEKIVTRKVFISKN